MTISWEKPNGNKITTNGDKVTIEYCESLGFKRISDVQPGDGDGTLKGSDPEEPEEPKKKKKKKTE